MYVDITPKLRRLRQADPWGSLRPSLTREPQVSESYPVSKQPKIIRLEPASQLGKQRCFLHKLDTRV